MSDAEVIVVNDGSTDGSARVLDDLAAEEPLLRVVTHEQNRGYGGALLSGFAAATKQWVFYTDGDGQFDPAELELLVQRASDDVDVVQGYKLRRADGPLRTVIGRVYHRFVKFFFGLKIRDTDCDFRLIRHATLDRVRARAHDRGHLRRAGAQAPGRRRAVHRGGRPPLPPCARQVGVLPGGRHRPHALGARRPLDPARGAAARAATGRGQRVASSTTTCRTGTSWWASHAAFGVGHRREHPVERAAVDVGAGGHVRGAGGAGRARRGSAAGGARNEYA